MAFKVVLFDDQFESETTPTTTAISTDSFSTYVDDAAYVTAKGSAAAEGDAYGNTTLNVIRYYDGTAWRSQATITYADGIVTTHANLTEAHGATGAVVGTTNAQVITNKDIDGGTASNTNRVTVPKNTTSNLSALTRKAATIFYDTTEGKFKGDDGTDIIDLGGGGGGGSISWSAPDGVAPFKEEEFNQDVYKYGDGLSEELWAVIKVPESYSGAQIYLYLNGYSESTSNTWKLQTTTYLVRSGIDAVNTTTNSHASTNSNITNATTAYKCEKISLDLCDANGAVNSILISAGDFLRVKLTRAGGTSDTADIRLIDGAAELVTS